VKKWADDAPFALAPLWLTR